MENEILNLKGVASSFIDGLEVKDTEWVEAREKEIREAQEKEKAARLESHYRNHEESGVNQRYWKESLETYRPETAEEKKALACCMNYTEKKGRQMLLLIGNCGTGKTHLGCGIVRKMGGRIVSSFEISMRYEMGADYRATQSRLEVLNYYSNLPLLVIDEIGRGNPATEKLILPYLINQRYENGLPLVMITNLAKDSFTELIGGAGVDRLNEVCSTLTFSGRSRRQ